MTTASRYRIAVFALAAGLGTAALVHSAAAVTTPPVVEVVPSAQHVTVPAVVEAAAGKPAPVAAAPAVQAPAKVAPIKTAPARRSAPKPVVKPVTQPVTPPAPVRDGYPWARATTNAHDDWGFTRRQCVSYVAWRLAVSGRAISNAGNPWGSALNWDETARRQGVPVSSRPAVGAVAHWNAGESSAAYAPGSSTPSGRFVAGGYGHVGYVTAVYSDGSVQVAQYNLQGDRKYLSLRMKAPRFLHFA